MSMSTTLPDSGMSSYAVCAFKKAITLFRVNACTHPLPSERPGRGEAPLAIPPVGHHRLGAKQPLDHELAHTPVRRLAARSRPIRALPPQSQSQP